MMRRTLYAISSLSILVGVWGLYLRLTTGHELAAYGSYVVWGLWVAMYLFFVGTASGAFMLACLDFLFNVKAFAGTGRILLATSLIALGAGLLSIWFDLGHLDRIWRVYLTPNPLSVMAQLVWGYTVFGLLTLLALISSMSSGANRRYLRALIVVNLPIAVFLSGAAGALLGVETSRPFWHVGLFPVQFPVFSLASGGAALLVAYWLIWDKSDESLRSRLRVVSLIVIALQVVKLYFLWADLSQSLYGGLPQNVRAVEAVLFGQYWWGFWILQLGIGTFVPLAILLWAGADRNWFALAGALTLFGFAVARANIIFPALTIPELDALASAFVDPRLQFKYAPSLMEWALQVGIVGLAGLAFLIASDRLPLVQPQAERVSGRVGITRVEEV